MKIEDNRVVLESTGRSMYAYGGILGIRAEPVEDTIFHGYDGTLEYPEPEDGVAELRPEERKEIAEHMVARWKEWGGLP